MRFGHANISVKLLAAAAFLAMYIRPPKGHGEPCVYSNRTQRCVETQLQQSLNNVG